jgi:uncharacterized repeat protein (TIGR04076 family)
MRKWFDEDWMFTITVLKVGQSDYAEECRLGFEPGDQFECQYECPGGFCPTALMHIFPIMEIIRCDGDLRNLGSQYPHEAVLPCPDGAVTFRVEGRKK